MRLSGQAGILAAGAMIAAMFMGSTILSPLYTLYEQVFGLSRIASTLLYAVYVVGNCTALLFFGRLADQIGRRRVALPAILVSGVGAFLFLIAHQSVWLFIARALTGFGVGVAAGVGAAWIAELDPNRDRTRAALIAVISNFLGIALGPLIAGVLAQYSDAPLRWPFVVYLAIVACVALAISRVCETVDRRGQVSLMPRLGVPAPIRAQFVAPALAAFSLFSLYGFYFALAPALLKESLHVKNLAAGGAIVGELALAAAITVLVTRRMKARPLMLSGLALLPVGTVALVVAQVMSSMWMLIVATAISGIGGALCYRGSLQVVNKIAPADRRAEVTSSYFLVSFLGNSVPIIGVALLGALIGSIGAYEVFGAIVALIAIAALLLTLFSKEYRAA